MKIVIIGSGNVAHQMGRQLNANGVKISLVIGRNSKRTKELADLLGCSFGTNFDNTDKPDLAYLLAVSDQSIEQVARKIKYKNAVMIHTSGSMDINLLTGENNGVIWPLYSISKDTVTNWKKAPLIVEYSSEKAEQVVTKISLALGGDIFKLNSEQRAHAHLLAVFINNFSQHLFYLIAEHQEKMNINPEMYNGILNDTVDKILNADLKNNLTGPARRNDKITMNKHLELLNDVPNMKTLYKNFSKSIVKKYYGEKL